MKKSFEKGEIIFREGDKGDCFYEIIKGKVGVYLNYQEANEQKLTEIHKEHIVGEMALVEEMPRSATVVALQDTEAEAVFGDELREYFEKSPDRIVFLIKELGERLTRLTEDYGDACDTIRELFPENEKRKENVVDKIKKYVNQYKMINRYIQPSAEFLRESGQARYSLRSSDDFDEYRRGTVIFREDEPGSCMYGILEGSVGIYTGYGKPNEKCLTTMESGTFFGELGLLTGEPRTATAVVMEQGTKIESIYMDDFDELFKKSPEKVDLIIRYISSRIRKLTYEYADACKTIFDVAQAEEGEGVSAELIRKAKEYCTYFYY